jgi:hypothetical protein
MNEGGLTYDEFQLMNVLIIKASDAELVNLKEKLHVEVERRANINADYY